MVSVTTTSPQNVLTNAASHSAWIEDGILYNEYQREVTVSDVLDNQEKSVRLIRDKNIKILPIIVNLNQNCLKSLHLY